MSSFLIAPSILSADFTQLLVPAVGLTLMFTIWPALVALVSHLTKHDARVFTQIGLCFVFYNLSWLTDLIENIVKFNTSSHFPLTALLTLLPIGLAFCLFWVNCYVGFHMSKRRRLVAAASLTALLFGGSFLVQLSKKPDFSVKPQFNSTLMTPNFMFATSNTVDKFVADSSELFKKAQKEANKERK